MKNGWKWSLVAAALLVIFGLTLQNGPDSGKLSGDTLQWIVTMLEKAGVNPEILAQAWWNDGKMIRRLAHVPEYFLLGLGVGMTVGDRRKGVGVCLGVSLLDEVVKAMIPMKEFDAVDMMFDAVGYGIGMAMNYGAKNAFFKCLDSINRLQRNSRNN